MTGDVLNDGTYEGKAYKFPGRFLVTLEVKDGRITDVQVRKHAAIRKYANMVKPMLERIVEKQTADVDIVTGATMSCRVLKKAAGRAIEEAKAGSQE